MRKKIFVIAILMVVVGATIATIYYKSQNNLVDPRVAGARELYKEYNMLAIQNNFEGVLNLMDSIEHIYNNYPFYYNSYEVGVLYNNRTATLLTLAMLHDSAIFTIRIDSLVTEARVNAQKSTDIYENWLRKFEGFNQESFDSLVLQEYRIAFGDTLNVKKLHKMSRFRAKEMFEAVKENKRRLSVVYTNMGVIHRYFKDYREAALCYNTAIKLWENNLTAQNNLNKLLGRPLVERNFIQRMFPQEK